MDHKADFDRFIKHLDESEVGVLSAAKWLRSFGYSVTIPPTTKAKSYEDRLDHQDDGDLYINMRIEVKRLGINFTSKDDWKFGSKFIVCAQHSFDRAKPNSLKEFPCLKTIQMNNYLYVNIALEFAKQC